MKTETKTKIKKALKVGAYVGGLMLALILGMGFGSCSEKKVQDQSSQKSEPKQLNPRFAVENDERPDLLSEYGTYCNGIVFTLDSPPTIARASTLGTYLLSVSYLHLGSDYYFICPENETFTYGYCSMGAGQSMIASETGVLNDGDVVASIYNFGDVRKFTPTAGSLSNYWYLWVRGSRGGTPRLVLADSNDYYQYYVETLYSLDFPTEFFPYGLSGQRKSEYFCGGPAVTSGTLSNTYFVTLNGVYFVSNGQLYNQIFIGYTYRANLPVLYYSDTGALQVRGTAGESLSDPNYYPSSVTFGNSSVSNSSVMVWQANYASIETLSGFDYGLLAGGVWTKPQYRHIEIKAFVNPSVNSLPSTAIGQYDVEGWLDWLAVDRVVYDPSGSAGNPFTLLGQAFSSVGGILQIQILPFITLGTLLFVPLIVLVILAILKLLAK